jgi:protein involved in polysaccharide export with SLBB domain
VKAGETHIGFGRLLCTRITTNKLIRVLLAVFFVAAVSMTIANAAGRRVAASDVIQIHVLNQPDLDTQVRVAPDGTISFPYVGRFRAAGLTEDVIAARIRKALVSAGIVK